MTTQAAAARSRSSTLEILGVPVLVVRKPQKNMYLSVRPDGSLRVTCPTATGDGEITAFVSSHADWLRRRKAAVEQSARMSGLEYVSGDTVPLWGVFYTLEVRSGRPCGVFPEGDALALRAPENSTREERAALIERFYRAQMMAAVPPLLHRWQPFLGVNASGVTIRAMTSRWGSCNTRSAHITLNLRLAEKRPCCLEYVVVHELCHLLEGNHSQRFWNHVARCLPDWRKIRELTNEAVKEPMDE